MKTKSAGPLLLLLCFLLCGSSLADTLNFDSINASATPYFVDITTTTYLAQYGITLTNVTAGTTVGILCPSCGGSTILPSSGQNALFQIGNNNGESYTLQFSTPLSTISFDLAGNSKNGGSGTLVSAWQVTAFNAGNGVVASVGQNMFSTFSAFAPQLFTLNGPGITHVTFFANCFNVCGTILTVDDISSPDIHLQTVQETPEPSSIILLGTGLSGLAGAIRRKIRNA